MIVGGRQPISLLDYPDKVATIVFTQGCNFRCRYCYNAMLVRPLAEPNKTTGHHLVDDLWSFLKSRQDRLEAVVITGGEPTLHFDLPEFIAQIKDYGLLVKLDTNGTNFALVQQLVDQQLIDYLAMDIKAPWSEYQKIMPTLPSLLLEQLVKQARLTAEWLINDQPIDYEFRTTLVPDLSTAEDVRQMAQQIKGAHRWFLQRGRLEGDLLDPTMLNRPAYTEIQMKELLTIAQEHIPNTQIR